MQKSRGQTLSMWHRHLRDPMGYKLLVESRRMFRELLRVLLALEQPPEQSYFQAGHRSPVQSTAANSSSLEVWGPSNHPQRAHRTPCSTLQHTRVTLVPLQLKPLPAMGSIGSKAGRLPNHPAAAGGPRWRGGAATSAHSSQPWLLWCCEQLGRCCCWPSVIKVSLQPPLGWGGLESLA